MEAKIRRIPEHLSGVVVRSAGALIGRRRILDFLSPLVVVDDGTILAIGISGALSIHYITLRLVASDVNCAVDTIISGDWVAQFSGTFLQDDSNKQLLMAYNDTPGTGGGPMVVDIHKNGTTIFDTNKLDIESGDKNTTDATIQPDLDGIIAVIKGDIFTFDIDVKHTNAAKGLVVAFAVQES